MAFQNGGYNYKNFRIEKKTADELARIKKRKGLTYDKLFRAMIKNFDN